MTDVLVLPPAGPLARRGDEFDAYNARSLPLVLRHPLACKACPTRRIVVDKGSTTLALIEGAIQAHVDTYHRSNGALARRQIGAYRPMVTAAQTNIRPIRRS